MPTVIEKVLIPLSILGWIAVVFYNPMQFDLPLRLGAGGGVSMLLLSLAAWLHRQNQRSNRQSKWSVLNAAPVSEGNSTLSPQVWQHVSVDLDNVDVDVNYIHRLFHTHTDVQARQLVKPYLGKRMSVSGTIMDVLPPLDDGGGRIHLQPDGSTSLSSLRFDKEWSGHLHTLHKGARLNVVGRIYNIDRSGVDLENCQITK